ncbi:MAG: tRNA (guanosine(37)-N1)-methyltransferase TrmD [Candidatus Pacebacteria bacterium]|nr:tRNA (guanosine(37)-N1)-methyltransferase TrmD [Candidatus Paceibacterota bacterium]
MNFHIITIFPEMFDSYLSESIIARAQKEKKIKIQFYNPRDFTRDKHKKVDNTPYGGGPGMVMTVDPIIRAVKRIQQKILRRKKRGKIKIIITSPSGKELTNTYADKILNNKYTDVVIICGRYEGIDSRVQKIFKAESVNIGNYVLTGGELPAMVILDVVTRRLPGVLGNIDSLEESRVSSSEMYTRPEVYEYEGKKYRVPKVLLSGNHKEIEEWKNR